MGQSLMPDQRSAFPETGFSTLPWWQTCGQQVMTVKPAKPENASLMSWLEPAGWGPNCLGLIPTNSLSGCVALGRLVIVSGLYISRGYTWMCSANPSSHSQVPCGPTLLALRAPYPLVHCLDPARQMSCGSCRQHWKKALLNCDHLGHELRESCSAQMSGSQWDARVQAQ